MAQWVLAVLLAIVGYGVSKLISQLLWLRETMKVGRRRSGRLHLVRWG